MPQLRATSTAVTPTSRATCMTRCQSGPPSGFTRRRTHILLHIGLFGTPCTFLYSPFVLEHRLAPSLHVHNPSSGSGQVGKNTAHFPFLFPFACPPQVARYVCYEFPSQPCRWGHECSSRSASLRPVSTSFERLARSPLALNTHTHTGTFSPSSHLSPPRAFAFPSSETTPNSQAWTYHSCYSAVQKLSAGGRGLRGND